MTGFGRTGCAIRGFGRTAGCPAPAGDRIARSAAEALEANTGAHLRLVAADNDPVVQPSAPAGRINRTAAACI
jgi:hypothetical protein